MTTITENQMTETALTAAAQMAAKLGMQQATDITMLEDQHIIIATAKGIQMGTLRARSGEMRTYRYTDYTLNGDLLAREQFPIIEQGWDYSNPNTTIYIEGATIYAAY